LQILVLRLVTGGQRSSRFAPREGHMDALCAWPSGPRFIGPLTYDAPDPARRAGIVRLRHERAPKVLMPPASGPAGTWWRAGWSSLRSPALNESTGAGHFAAWEEPQLFSEEVRAAFESLR
jgi:hypothetical protein